MATELHSAFAFDCDECGRENFVRALAGNLDEAAVEAAESRVDPHLIAPEARDTGDGAMEAEYLIQRIVIAPQTVTCRHCGHSDAAAIASIES